MEGSSYIRKDRTTGIIILIMSLACIYMIYILASQQGLISANSSRILNYQRLLEIENEHNAALQEKNATLMSDENIEKWARERLGLVKPGEKVFIAVGE